MVERRKSGAPALYYHKVTLAYTARQLSLALGNLVQLAISKPRDDMGSKPYRGPEQVE